MANQTKLVTKNPTKNSEKRACEGEPSYRAGFPWPCHLGQGQRLDRKTDTFSYIDRCVVEEVHLVSLVTTFLFGFSFHRCELSASLDYTAPHLPFWGHFNNVI